MKRTRFFLLSISIFLLLSITSIETIEINYFYPKSPESNGLNYKFIVFGDTRRHGDDNSGLELVSNLIEDLMQEHEIEFIIHTGDLVYYGGDQSEYDTYYWPVFSSIEDAVDVYYVVGNHEYSRSGGSPDYDLTTYLANVENPGNEIYYSFNSPQNDTHFIVLNSDYYFNDNNVTRQEEQQAWLENDLVSNTLDRIIVMFHRPYWGANPARAGTEYELLRPVWHEFLVEHDVDLVFNGHDHYFYHTVRNNTDYTVTGGGTVAFCVPIPTSPYIQEIWQEDDFAFAGLHVCLVEATEAGFNVDVIMTNKTTVYEYSVSEPAPEIYPPWIESPNTVVMAENSSGNIVSWVLTDANPGNYSIYQDGVIVDNGSWSSGTPIEYPLDDLTINNYNFTIVATDKFGHESADIVLVQVVATITTTTTTIPTSTSSTSSTETTTKGETTPGFSPSFLFLILVVFLYRKKR